MRRFKVKRVMPVLIGIGLLLASACAPAAVPPRLAASVDDIAGTWHKTSSVYAFMGYIQFKPDGTGRLGAAFDGVEVLAKVEGEYWFEGTQLFWKAASAEPNYEHCLQPGKETGKYNIEILPNGNLKFEMVEDGCPSRVAAFTGEWEPVL
jgi:hypothetical protein